MVKLMLTLLAIGPLVLAGVAPSSAQVKDNEPSCVVMDVQLSDLSGIELARHLLASGLKLPTVFIGSKEQGWRRQALEVGCVAFVERPFPARVLVEAVVTATGSNPFFDK